MLRLLLFSTALLRAHISLTTDGEKVIFLSARAARVASASIQSIRRQFAIVAVATKEPASARACICESEIANNVREA